MWRAVNYWTVSFRVLYHKRYDFVGNGARRRRPDLGRIRAYQKSPMLLRTYLFQDLLETLVFTNGSDKDLVSRIYGKVFTALFASKDIEVMDFHGLGWAFPVNDFAEAALSFCGDRLRVLNLAENRADPKQRAE